jgi:hypothetical protein
LMVTITFRLELLIHIPQGYVKLLDFTQMS